jgi:hypothetical protein
MESADPTNKLLGEIILGTVILSRILLVLAKIS